MRWLEQILHQPYSCIKRCFALGASWQASNKQENVCFFLWVSHVSVRYLLRISLNEKLSQTEVKPALHYKFHSRTSTIYYTSVSNVSRKHKGAIAVATSPLCADATETSVSSITCILQRSSPILSSHSRASRWIDLAGSVYPTISIITR